MNNKYYTPEIEEFHVGFEFEYIPRTWNWILDGTGKDWIKESFSASCGQDGECEIHEIEKSIEENKCRVKHLDREDILSCNWEHKFNGFSEDGKTTFDKFQRGDMFLLHEDDGHVVIWMENLSSVTYFRGTIKNKSVLKQVLKMIGV